MPSDQNVSPYRRESGMKLHTAFDIVEYRLPLQCNLVSDLSYDAHMERFHTVGIPNVFKMFANLMLRHK
jgi:hypothetical protein